MPGAQTAKTVDRSLPAYHSAADSVLKATNPFTFLVYLSILVVEPRRRPAGAPRMPSESQTVSEMTAEFARGERAPRGASRPRQVLPSLWPLSALRQDNPSQTIGVIANWVRSYLMRPHNDLGRAGDVCPFTAQASRLDTIRLGVSDASASETNRIMAIMEGAVTAFDEISCAKSMRHFRTIIVGFPNCADADGLRALKHVQNRLRPHSIFRGKMVGFFEPNSQDKGLLNPDFRPLRSPVPLLAIRMLVENDSPFVMRNPLLAPIYLAKFRLKGLRRLISALR
jgi:hypothetical protein